MTSSVTMAGLAPVGVKQQRARRVAAAAPARAHLGSAFTSGGGKSLEGQRLSVAVAPAAGARRGSRCVTSMAAKIAGYIKLAIEAGKANPAPPIGPALGAKVRFLRLFPPVRWSGERSGRNAGGGKVPGDALATITRPLERAVRARVGCLMGIPTPSPRVLGASPSRRPRARVSRRAETLTLFAFFASPYLTLKRDRISNADRPAPSRPFLPYPGCEHHDVLQGVQRQDPGPGGHHHPRRDHRLRGARASHRTDPPFSSQKISSERRRFFHQTKNAVADPFPYPLFHPTSRPQDKSFTFVLKTPPAAELIKKAAGIGKGAANGVTDIVGSITRDQLEEIAKTKLPDLNADKVESAMRIVAGTAHNMGVTIEGWEIEESKAGFREEKAAIWGMKPDDLVKA